MSPSDRQFNFDSPQAILAQKIFQNLPNLHLSCQNTLKPIINQMMFLYLTDLLLHQNTNISFRLFLSAEQ